MIDPRTSIPDTILTAPDGSRWLVRSRQLLVGAVRKQAPTVVVDGELLPVASIDADGNANVMPGVGTVQAFPYSLPDLPEALGAALAAWLAGQASVNGAKMLARLYPTAPLETIAQINLSAHLALADNDNGASAVPSITSANLTVPQEIIK